MPKERSSKVLDSSAILCSSVRVPGVAGSAYGPALGGSNPIAGFKPSAEFAAAAKHDVHITGQRAPFAFAIEGLDPVQQPIGEHQKFPHFRFDVLLRRWPK